MSRSTSRRRRPGGFALIIVVALLALLVMVLVSLATLTRIEAQVGANSRIHAQARQNAKFALDQAMAELQRHAGADTRITATGDLVSATLAPGVRYWTSVWDSSDANFRAWLVSGTENLASPVSVSAETLSVSPALDDPQNPLSPLALVGGSGAVPCQILAGSNTLGSVESGYIVAPLVEMEAPSPDGTGDAPAGRYAWWIADEGVKASLALRDRIDEVDYGPYASAELRARLRQQVPMAHQDFRSSDGSGTPKRGFDPALAANAAMLRNVIARNQIPFLTPASGTSLFTSTRNLFHDWTTVSSGVLASTNSAHGGLKRDLSRNPGLLGATFATWAGLGYMETPGFGNTAVPPITNNSDVRRRYVMQLPSPASPATDELTHSVAPVLAEFIIQFGIKRPTASSSSIEVRVRMCVSVWNPYTSALVPQDLRLSVTGLPTVSLTSSGGGAPELLNLQSVFDAIVPGGNEVHLDWSATDNDSDSDFASWLPGRVYYWRTDDGSPVPDLLRYRKRVSSASGWAVSPAIATGLSSGDISISRTDPTSIVVALRRGDGSTLSTTTGFAMNPISPAIQAAGPSDQPNSPGYWRLGFGFRLRQPTTAVPSNSWLATAGQDPRNPEVLPGQTMSYNPNGTALSPTNYGGSIVTEWNGSTGSPGILLNRDTVTGPVLSYDNDAPVFEFPRSPILSLGMLQHLRVQGARPFAIGNSWGAALSVPGVDGGGTVASWWDRFYFSGLASDSWGPDIPGGEPLPWVHLRPIDTRASPSTTFDVSVVRSGSPHTSQFLLLDGAFNVNSTSVAAWEAVLRSLRFTAPTSWSTANLQPDGNNGGSVSSGTAVSTSIEDTTQGAAGSMAARTSGFLRFSQSAQETFETSGSVSGIDRSRFRQGVRAGNGGPSGRALTSSQMRTLAEAIVARVREHFAAVGRPYRHMQDFLSPNTAWSNRSLLEQAIVDASLNSAFSDFSSYTLTQADILTAIGPFLQCRSDTFLIRTYGEAVNPVTGEVDSRAWCEATVQRIPTKVEPGDITTSASRFGRRFVITSFRWLSPDDI